MPDNLRLPPAVRQGPKQDRLKQIDINRAGTGKCHQLATGFDELEAVQVEVFVAACGALDLLLVLGELRRVTHDYIKLLTLRNRLAEILECIGLNETVF